MNDSERAAQFVREWNDAVNYERAYGPRSGIQFQGPANAGWIDLGWSGFAALLGFGFGILGGGDNRYVLAVVMPFIFVGVCFAILLALRALRVAARLGITGIWAVDRLLARVPSWTIAGGLIGSFLGAWAAEFDSGFMQGVVVLGPVGALIGGLWRFLIFRRRARSAA